MSYNRPPYQPYDDANPNQPYPVGYPPEMPPYQGQLPYDSFAYPAPPYGDPSYPSDPPRRDSYGYPRDYDDMAGSMDYRDPILERPRESWNERAERMDSPPSFKRDHNGNRPPPRRNGPDMHRPRKPHAPPPKNIDPYTVNYIVPFNYFCDWYKATNARTLSKTSEISKEELQESFIKYRDDLLSRTAKDFVKEHLTEPWFREKYDPAEAPVTKSKRAEYRKWLYEAFMSDLETGKFDELTLDGVAARRHFSEKNGTQQVQSPGTGKDGEVAAPDSPSNKSVGGVQAPSDPMAERPTPCIKTISTSVSRAQLEALLEDVEGFKYLSISDPNSNKKFARVGWVILNDPADPESVIRSLDEQKIHDDIYGDFIVHAAIHTPVKEQPRKALAESYSTQESLIRDLRLAEASATKKFEKELGEGYQGIARIKAYVAKLVGSDHAMVVEEEEGVIKEESVTGSLEQIKKTLDIVVEYLRRVYSFCFYCVSENDSVHELQRKCFAGHFRRPPPQESSTDVKPNSYMKSWEDKVNLLINPEEADILKLGGVNVEEVVEKEIQAAMTKEADDRWRCGVKKCTKLFLEEKFVRSHIQKRHKDWLDKISSEAEMLNRYVLDPCRVLSPNVEQPPPTFTQKHEKEFIHHPPSQLPFGNPAGFPPFPPPTYMFDAPPDWQFYASGMRVDERPPPAFRGRRGSGVGGPMRRHGPDGGRNHPYERRPQQGFHDRRNGDGPGGPMRVREMRNLKSYRDLDAPQEATPELNY